GAGARGEAEDTVAMAVEALTFDVRRAGWDPTAAGVEALVTAAPDRLTVTADLDGNGAIDATSAETRQQLYSPAPRRLAPLVGRRSLPLADGVARCALRYLDAAGSEIPTPAAGLDAATRRRVRAVALDLALLPTRLHAAVARTALVALRVAP